MFNWLPNPAALAADKAELAGAGTDQSKSAVEAIRLMAEHGDPAARELSDMLVGDIEVSDEHRRILARH